METKQKEFVTHEELDVWGGEIMRQIDEVRAHIKDIQTKMVTKEEAQMFTTKQDLERFATKEEIDRIFIILDEIRENTKR